MLAMGREVRMPSELVFESLTKDESQTADHGKYITLLWNGMQRAHKIAREHLQVAAKNKDIYDVKLSINKYNVGDVIWLLTETRMIGVSTKLMPTY